MIPSALTLSLISIVLFVLLLKDNDIFLNLLYKLRDFWFYDYINVILVIGIIPVLNVILFSALIIYSIIKLLRKIK
jgi:hypothetical protein